MGVLVAGARYGALRLAAAAAAGHLPRRRSAAATRTLELSAGEPAVGGGRGVAGACDRLVVCCRRPHRHPPPPPPLAAAAPGRGTYRWCRIHPWPPPSLLTPPSLSPAAFVAVLTAASHPRCWPPRQPLAASPALFHLPGFFLRS